ncbi:MAG: HAMP domain-containing protein, partial [Fimbriimonadaceae bacterium]|nr:HAMP domain-containing protein [Fimbriimonadaceae bacterium]
SRLRTSPGLSAAGMILDSDGTLIRAQRQNDQTVQVQISRPRPGGGFLRRDFNPLGNELVETGSEAWAYDPRREPYYDQVRLAQRPEWSDTYVIRSPMGLDAPGISCVAPIRLDTGMIGAVTIDITLAELSRFLQTIRAGDNGFAFLAEPTRSGSYRLIAHPEPARLLISQDGVQRIATLSELDDPLLTMLVDRMGDLPAEGDEMQRSPLQIRGERWLVGMRRLQGGGLPNWIVTVAIPESDYTAGLQQQGLFLLVVAAAAMLGAVAGSFVLANRVTRPIQALIDETEQIRKLKLDARELPDGGITEIRELGAAVEQMKTGLRSLQKLVPADYARRLIQSGQEASLGGERRRLTISFADLIGFTALSETVSPEVLSTILAEYLEVLSREVIRSGGTVDKFNGDDVMSFWGAPDERDDHARAACLTALASRDALFQTAHEWAARDIPLLRVSWGIATGDVVVGNVGSRERMNYTVIGDRVNLASRLQGINRAYGTEILVSRETADDAGAEFAFRMVDRAIPVGKEESVEIVELVGLRDRLPGGVLAGLRMYEAAWRDYAVRNWDAAETGFRETLAEIPDDPPSLVMLSRIERYRRRPPEPDWHGDHRVGSK